MTESHEIERLSALARDTGRAGHGARIRKALLLLAIPAAAALTTACYGAPMSDRPYEYTADETAALGGVDCDGDGIADAPRVEDCTY